MKLTSYNLFIPEDLKKELTEYVREMKNLNNVFFRETQKNVIRAGLDALKRVDSDNG